MRCRSCGVSFQSTPPTPAELEQYYPGHYGPYQKAAQTATRVGFFTKTLTKPFRKLLNAQENLLQRRLDSLYQPSVAGLTLLDYGCGSDEWLKTAKQKGWRTIGVDFSPDVVKQVKAAGHEAYLVSENLWREIPDESVDLIRLNHVIEHLYDPLEVLQNLFQKLKPRGQLHLATPNPSGLSSRLFRSRWLGLDCPRHLVLFPPRLMERDLKKTGFARAELWPQSVTKDFARSLGFVLTDLGWMDHADIYSLMDQPLLAATLAVPCHVAAKIGWCDRYHVIAQKGLTPGDGRGK